MIKNFSAIFVTKLAANSSMHFWSDNLHISYVLKTSNKEPIIYDFIGHFRIFPKELVGSET